MLPSHLQNHIESQLGVNFTEIRPVKGGDINLAFRASVSDGRVFFIKYNDLPEAYDMFRAEALGLALIGAPRVIATPKVFLQGTSELGEAYLVMEYFEPGTRNKLFWETFGRQLADLHGVTSAQFGFAHNNYIGSLPQRNHRHDSWEDFYSEERLRPQLWLARHQEKLEKRDEQALEKLIGRLKQICPVEQPALIHGDLWAGNFICCRSTGRAVLIDPATSFAHREMDLAMAHLFGGFEESFFNAYQEYWPLNPGFKERMPIYQLYYLLVHVNLFGGQYIEKYRAVVSSL